jgi:DNA replication and repair protein RecF
MERQQVAPGRQAEAQLTSLSLRDFRNYADCRVMIDAANVLLLGENGSGKTNLMEAISLLAPGRGLRRARAEHLPRQG